MAIEHVDIAPADPGRFREVLDEQGFAGLEALIARGRETLDGTVVWNVNSTAKGGGVAELLRSLIAYVRGAGIDARWVVAGGDPDFFAVTKRIHNKLHGAAGDGGGLGPDELAVIRHTSESNAADLAELVRPGDVVIAHDPQTTGLVEGLVEHGATVIWRCHIGIDGVNEHVQEAWDLLTPLVLPAHSYVFHRQEFAWPGLDPERVALIRPSIDAFSPKNAELAPEVVRAILNCSGLVEDPSCTAAPVFERIDGTPGRVDRRMVIDQEAPLAPDTPAVVQVSRWDVLKDPRGVIDAFAGVVAPRTDAHLVLAGPDVTAVADDPEGRQVLEDCRAHRLGLPEEIRVRVHLASLPMDDGDENAAMVNAVQRHAAVVVQKSLAEGFGLTVAEAMWKGRPVVAGKVGGIQEQIEHGDSGLLVDPTDLTAVGDAIAGLLEDPEGAEAMGTRARERVRREFLAPRHLDDYMALIARLRS